MKTKIDNYTFDKVAKTVTFTDYTTIRLDSILLITNVTDNVIVYNFADPSLGGTVTNNVLTLTYDTSSMDNTDKLQIFYEGDNTLATNDLQVTLNSLAETLQELVQRLAPLAGAMSNTAQLRTVVTGVVTASGGGYITSAQSIAEKGIGGISYPEKIAITNNTAIQSNINNATA